MRKPKRLLAYFLSASAMFAALCPAPASAEPSQSERATGYSAYWDVNTVSNDQPLKDITITGGDFLSSSKLCEKIAEHQSKTGSFAKLSQDGFAEWTFEVDEPGLYRVKLNFAPGSSKAGNIELSVAIDGSTPYDEASRISLLKKWTDDVENGEFRKDASQNDIRPTSSEIEGWRECLLYDTEGYYDSPLAFPLTNGTHTLRITLNKENVILNNIVFCDYAEPDSYNRYYEKHKADGAVPASGNPIEIQAEHLHEKSNFTIHPLNDRTSPATIPQSVTALRLNTIGREKWQLPRQWISWEINVNNPGFYKIVPRFRQNINSGTFVSRKLLIDGEVPFKEAESLAFNFSDDWQQIPLGDQSGDFEFYLTTKTHVITMEVSLGGFAEIINDVSASLTELNEIYQKILLITGPSPDLYRDFDFPVLIPDVIESMNREADRLNGWVDRIVEMTGKRGEQTAILSDLTRQLKLLHEEPEKIAANFSSLESNIGSLGTWVNYMRNQPLELDCITFLPSSNEQPQSGSDGFFARLWFEIQLFFQSFFRDYNSIGAQENKCTINSVPLNIWIQTGRDQAEIVSAMINDDFIPSKNIAASLKLVAPGTMLPATLANIGPDVALSCSSLDPIDYAIRNANVVLSDMKDFIETAENFFPSALTPYTLNGKVYALPETQTFPVMFYRTDILKKLGLSVPTTWDEFLYCVTEIKRNNMDVAFPPGLPGLMIFMSQNNINLYRENGLCSNLDSDEAIGAFKTLCDLFTDYKLPVAYDFPNRFRSGEMPLGIADYSSIYNQLTVFAPQIKGHWGFGPVPGTKSADGKISNSVYSDGTSVMMFRNTKDKDLAWEFMKWWVSANIQTRFGTEMESVLGPSAKQPTANKAALQAFSWSTSDYNSIMTQWESAIGMPQVPGGYYVTREVEFAFNNVYNTGDDPAKSILSGIEKINEELLRKQKEFGMVE